MGLRVKEILKNKGMTMIELSEKLGIVNDTLTRNLKNPQLKTLERIAEAIGVDVSELFERPDQEQPSVSSFKCPKCGTTLEIKEKE